MGQKDDMLVKKANDLPFAWLPLPRIRLYPDAGHGLIFVDLGLYRASRRFGIPKWNWWRDFRSIITKRKCPKCHGIGKIVDPGWAGTTNLCRKCAGRGRIGRWFTKEARCLRKIKGKP